jgi:hypothetical protein
MTKQFAVIEDNKVVNVILANSLETAEEITALSCIDVTDGWNHNSGIDGGVFFPTPAVEEPTE